MSFAQMYYDTVLAQLEHIRQTQSTAIEQAAEWFCECFERDGLVYLFGTGHSHMLAEELFYRAGGHARIVPMLVPKLMLHVSASESTSHERDPDIVAELWQRYPITDRDVLVIISNSGRNAAPVELALQAKERKIRTIALHNAAHSAAFASRHVSGKRLRDVAELTIDNAGILGDAVVPLSDGSGRQTGATSTITATMILQMIACSAVEKALERGLAPELFQSANASQAGSNEAIVERYRKRIMHL